VSQEQGCELLPLSAIRTETVLSRFPIHNLAKTGNVDIQIRQTKEDGELDLRWEVSYNARYGEPRQLAYKLDTLIINRRIEEVGRPLPKIIRLGTLKDICRELGLPESGTATNHIKKALRQNVGALITAKLKYKGADGRVRSLEADFHRYSVVFKGETLPDGRKADAVYLILNEIYHDVLNTAQFRPLDYEYLKSLSPAAQRWYEVISYSMFAANKHRRVSADITYSDYCMYSGQERYFTWDKAKKQMYKLHQPHLKSGYITGFTHEATTDTSGSPDWILKYIAGEKAKSEYRTFQRSKRDVGGKTPVVEVEGSTVEPASRIEEALQHHSEPEEQSPLTNEESYFMNELVTRFSIHEDTARELVTTKLDRVKFQLEVYPYRQQGRIKDAAAYIIGAIRRNYTAPADYQAVKAKKEEESTAERAKALEASRKEHEEKFQSAYFEYLRREESTLRSDSPDAYLAFEEHNADAVMKAMRFVKNPTGPAGRAILSEETRLARFRDFFLPRNMVLSFWQWNEAHNAGRFQGQHIH
jgi:hypothetical protein